MTSTLKQAIRSVKETVLQYSKIEVKVRNATNNDKWGVSSSAMSEISRATNDFQEYPQLFAMLWKRLNDVEHVMHVYKALILVEYLLRNGAERFINDAKRRSRDIAQLTKYKHYDENNRDDAVEARNKAKQVYQLLTDDQRLKEERTKAIKIRDVKMSGFGSADPYGYNDNQYDNNDYNNNQSNRYNGNGNSNGYGDDYGNNDNNHNNNDNNNNRNDNDNSNNNHDNSNDTKSSEDKPKKKKTPKSNESNSNTEEQVAVDENGEKKKKKKEKDK